MQSLDVISINIWQMAVSLINLVILFLLVKKFLYKPVKKMLQNRSASIENDYNEANKALKNAEALELEYEQKISTAKMEADRVIKSAVDVAKARENDIIADAKQKADGIISKAKDDAELERRKYEEDIKREIADVSSVLAEKVIERELDADDHKRFIDSFLEDLGEDK